MLVDEVTSTPDLSAFLMLRRHSWFMPLSTSSSVRSGQRDLEEVLRLPGREAALGHLRPPAELTQLRDDARAHRLALGGREVTEAAYAVVGDALLDLRGRSSGG